MAEVSAWTRRRARLYARRFGGKMAAEDFYQAAMLAAIEVRPRIRKATEVAYLKKRAWGAMRSYAQAQTGISKHARLAKDSPRGRGAFLAAQTFSIEYPGDVPEGVSAHSVEAAIASIRLRADVEKALLVLSRRTRRIVREHMAGDSGVAIAARRKITCERVCQILAVARRLLSRQLQAYA